jgi:5-methyltetrahydropteroyltriglutamate--homocysteine methyltransferase
MASKDMKPPFRADHVGSLLRTPALLEAREKRRKGLIGAAELKAAEDAAIRQAVKLQEDVGLSGITDGEYRRTFFHIDFLEKLEGVAVKGGLAMKFHSKQGELEFAPPRMEVVSKLRRKAGIVTEDFKFLKSVAHGTPKLCIPSPTMLHFRGGRKAVDAMAYPDIDLFFDDLAKAYQQELKALGDLGATYVQLDDTNLAYLCDPAIRQRTKDIGEDPEKLPHLYAEVINKAIAGRPKGMTICIHLCRGNFQSAWVAEGGYEPVAEALFSEMKVDGYFLEYDDERSGDFRPLRFIPKGKMVVLGLISSKVTALEPKDLIKRRIDEAAKFVDKSQLCLSPQCGFSSTVEGNRISEAQEIAKLKLVVDVAKEVWG